MSEIMKSVVFGVVEGITEWLPVSSTGHLLLLEPFLKFGGVSPAFDEMYRVVIQLGAILAVMVCSFRRLNPIHVRHGIVTVQKQTLALWGKAAVGCVPAGVCGILLNDWIEAYAGSGKIVAAALILYGILFIITEKRKRAAPIWRSTDDLPLRTAFGVGLFQALALLPGTSRSGATMLGGLLLGVSREAAAEYSFFMAIPVMFGASVVKLMRFGWAFTAQEARLLAVGFLTAFAVSLPVIRALLRFVRTHTLTGFGIYRIALGCAVLLLYSVQ